MAQASSIIEYPDTPQGKNEVKALFIEMRAKGLSIRATAKELRLSPQTLLNWQVELEEEIARLKAVELESLYEQYHLLKEHRLQLLGGQLQNIKDELSKRDLSEVPTDKLLDIQLRYLDDIRKEYVEFKPLSDKDIEALRNKTGTKLDSRGITVEIYQTFLRFKAGLIDTVQANREIIILQNMLKAEDQGVLQKKLEWLEGILEGRK
jgi:hypothetical protein